MKKPNLKTLAIIGLASGIVMAGQVTANSLNESQHSFLAGGSCSGKSGCKGSTGTNGTSGTEKPEEVKKAEEVKKEAEKTSSRASRFFSFGNGSVKTDADKEKTDKEKAEEAAKKMKNPNAGSYAQMNEDEKDNDENDEDLPSGGQNRTAKIRLYAQADKPEVKEGEIKPEEKKDNIQHSVNGTRNGTQFAMMHEKEGELSESRLISQLSKENLELYRKMSFEDKALVRKLSRESGDANKGFQMAQEQIKAREAAPKEAAPKEVAPKL